MSENEAVVSQNNIEKELKEKSFVPIKISDNLFLEYCQNPIIKEQIDNSLLRVYEDKYCIIPSSLEVWSDIYMFEIHTGSMPTGKAKEYVEHVMKDLVPDLKKNGPCTSFFFARSNDNKGSKMYKIK